MKIGQAVLDIDELRYIFDTNFIYSIDIYLAV